MESEIGWLIVIGSFGLAGAAVGVLAWAFVKAANMATRRPYWLVELNEHGIRNAPKFESRRTSETATAPEWGDPIDVDAGVDEPPRTVGERG